MAEDKGDPIAPADGSSSTPGNPHFIGRYTFTTHSIRRELMWTSYGAREAMLDIIRVARDGANDKDVPKRKKPLLKASAERVEAGLRVFVDKIDESDRNALLEVMWGMRGIGENSGRLTRERLNQIDGMQEHRTEQGEIARNLALRYGGEVRKAHPKWSYDRIGREIVGKVIAEVRSLREQWKDFSMEPETIAKLLRADAKRSSVSGTENVLPSGD